MRILVLIMSLVLTNAYADTNNDVSEDQSYKEYQQFREAVTEGFLHVNDQFGERLRLSAMLSACENRTLAAKITPSPEDISGSLLILRETIPAGVQPLIYLAAVQISLNTYGVGVMESIKQGIEMNNNAEKLCKKATADANALPL